MDNGEYKPPVQTHILRGYSMQVLRVERCYNIGVILRVKRIFDGSPRSFASSKVSRSL